jgi:hypothetical protein
MSTLLTNEQVVEGLANGTMSPADAKKALQAIQDQAIAKAKGVVRWRLNPESRNIVMTGGPIRQMGITMFASEVLAIAEVLPEVVEAVKRNRQYLPAFKGDKVAPIPAELIGEGKEWRLSATQMAASKGETPTAAKVEVPNEYRDIWTSEQYVEAVATAKQAGVELSALAGAVRAGKAKPQS